MGDASTNAVLAALDAAIELKTRELTELQEAKRRHMREQAAGTQKKLRFRAKSGFKKGSIPALVKEIMEDSKRPLSAAELAEGLKLKGRTVESKMIAASVARYIGTVFQRDPDGKYVLVP